MQTQPMFDDPSSKIEYAARTQMGLNDDWRIESTATAVHVGLEEQVDELQDSDCTDAERWRELDPGALPLAWLPQGLMLVTLRLEVNGTVEKKAGFVWVNDPAKGSE